MAAAGDSQPIGILNWLIAVVAVAAVSIGATLLSGHFFDETKAERIEAADSDRIDVESIFTDRIEGAIDPDYDPARYQAIAKSFSTDSVYFDGYPEFDIKDDEIAAIRTAIAGADTPIYVAFLNTSDLDDADGDLDLLAARIVTEMDDAEAAVLTVDATGIMGVAEKGVYRPQMPYLSGEYKDTDSRSALKGVRQMISAETEDLASGHSYKHDDNGNPQVVDQDTANDPHDLEYSTGGAVAGGVFGILVGGGAGIGIHFIRRALKKRTAKQ
ncbi:hypothetical protein SAMN04489752_3050 [Brevibacterium siliguriense]|uniref:TPM domain-containing protein n=1 Tax=Brevibacterium siliguriense TaxID=1136497 RepID=A0A1H1WQY5_9MICO|nr:hypothetical protein [Brevibacterium siliguriense]SDS99051.1 hypothetical protein SAMN04489752_3050 [Brevibacterium siliguriense]